MMKKWSYILASIAILTLSFLCVNNAEAKYTEGKSLTLSLNIVKHYEVAFDANGGEGSMLNQQFTVGEEQALSANEFTNAGFYFTGWNTSADGSGSAYIDEELISTDLTNVGGEVVTLYAQWGEDSMQMSFKIDGVCVFHGYDIQQHTGEGYITGTNCSTRGIDWADGTHKYIDSGVKLYDSDNYDKDYEIGFTIAAYDSAHQYKEPTDSGIQSTFFSAKLENSARHWPGIAVRKSNDKIEITETITKPNGSYEKKTVNNESIIPSKIRIVRVDSVVYYSVNDAPFAILQDNNGTSDYFDTNVWFGAASKDDGTPMRYIDATLTNIYIKVGDTGANKHTVSFDAGGVVTDPTAVTIIGSSKINGKLPSLPNYVDTANGRLYFVGWYTGLNGTGVKYTEDSIVNSDVTLHAYWSDELLLCDINGVFHGNLQDCVDEAGEGDTIILLENTNTHITVNSDKVITFDLNGHKISDNDINNKPVIENYGKIMVINGTMTSKVRAGVLNNNEGAEMYIGNGARIIATGIRQAIYNNGGKLTISGDAYLSASTKERATVQNLNNGELIIESGTIISEKQEAVKVESGTARIGIEDGFSNRNTPVLQGLTYGLNTSVDVSIFDGVLRGKTAAINNTARITETEVGSTAIGIDPIVTEVADGVTYKIIYYQ